MNYYGKCIRIQQIQRKSRKAEVIDSWPLLYANFWKSVSYVVGVQKIIVKNIVEKVVI